jgi:hypothetical protein
MAAPALHCLAIAGSGSLRLHNSAIWDVPDFIPFENPNAESGIGCRIPCAVSGRRRRGSESVLGAVEKARGLSLGLIRQRFRDGAGLYRR